MTSLGDMNPILLISVVCLLAGASITRAVYHPLLTTAIEERDRLYKEMRGMSMEITVIQGRQEKCQEVLELLEYRR